MNDNNVMVGLTAALTLVVSRRQQQHNTPYTPHTRPWEYQCRMVSAAELWERLERDLELW